MNNNIQTIWFAGGCFWGLQKYFNLIRGVTGTEVGYINGNTPNPTYEEVYTDTTGYMECVKVIYDAEILDLEDLIRFFFKAIDPTRDNGQAFDIGTRYKSGIFYHPAYTSDAAVAQKVHDEVSNGYSATIHVAIGPVKSYYPAEEYHQNYLDKNPGGYCHISPQLYEFAKKANGKKRH
jgi:peptide methionine sulfoxide reductase msrA/msrB